MLLEIIGGAILATGVMLGISWVSFKKTPPESSFLPEEELNPVLLGQQERSLEQKLRNAIYECERNINICRDELQRLYQQQIELLNGIGRVSHIFVENKPAAFVVINSVTNEKRYYYQRDLIPNLDEKMYQQTLALVQQYQNHIELYIKKIEVCQRLRISHQENMERLTGIHEQNEQWRRIREHQERLAASDDTYQRLEKDAILNQLKLEEIGEEVDFQEECLRQYTILNSQYSLSAEDLVPEQLQQELKQLLEKLEEKDVDDVKNG